jgi:hypothetical protein
MMALFGWDSPRLAAHYAKAASQKKLAAPAMHLLIPKPPAAQSGKPLALEWQTAQKNQ